MVASADDLQVKTEWADFNGGGGGSGFATSADYFVDAKKEKKKKKKKDKEGTSNSGSSDGSKKKRKKKTSEVNDFNSALFERAIADVLGDVEGSGITEDQAFVSAFASDDGSEFSGFKADFSTGNMQRPQKREPSFNEEDDGGGFVVENNRKGERMMSFSRRRSVHGGSQNGMDRAESFHSGKSGGSATRSTAETPRASNNNTEGSTSGERSVDFTPADIMREQRQFSARNVDFSSYELQLQAEQDQFGDSATINSELTGLTGVFSRMPSNFEDDDDSDSLTDEEPQMQFPKYDPAYSKFMMMQGQPKKNKPKQKVQFGSVTVRDFQRILGDNPSCKAGAPVSIGWKVAAVKTHPSPDAHYNSRSREPRPSAEFVMSRDYRHEMLLELGYSQREIAAAVRSVIKDKNRRRTTVNNLGTSSTVEEKMETAKNGLKRMLFMKKSSS